MSRALINSLESRVLLAGLTLITHGRDGHLWGFNDESAKAITALLGGPAQVPWYILKLVPDNVDGHLIPSITRVNNSTTPSNNSTGEIILEVDWTSVDKRTEYTLPYIAGVITDYLENTSVDGMKLAELPMHGFSISRGTGLLDEIARAYGKHGIWVDQESYCDPNPVEQMGDAPPTIYDNVAFVDNYWRTDGNPANFSTNGMPVDGAYNLNVQWLDSMSSGWPLTHLCPSGYYLGTIDPYATWGGEGPIYPGWYGGTHPARDQTGFLYSSIRGGTRPLSGVWTASGGTGARVATGQTGSQWANVADVIVSGGNSIFSGQTIQVNYLHQDRDSAHTVTLYLDSDRNPYNGATTLGRSDFNQNSSIVTGSTSVSTTGVAPGTYYICAKASDAAGHVRYSYSPVNAPLTVVGANGASMRASQLVANPAGYNLTSLGTVDWAHWGRAKTYTNFDHKATGGSKISNVTVVGAGSNVGANSISGRASTWTDGTPTGSVTNDGGYIWSNGALNTGYSFTAPADTTPRTLYVYAGGFQTASQLTAHLSDGSTADYVVTASGSASYTNLYAITYRAASAGQTIKITLLKTQNLVGTGGSVDVIAAALVIPQDTSPPLASLSAQTRTTGGSTPYTFNVTYSDSTAVRASTLGNGDLVVTGPGGYNHAATLVTTGLSDGSPLVVTYSVPAPAGGWQHTSNGAYTVTLQANQVSDTLSNFAPAGSVGQFTVNITPPNLGGSLSGTLVEANLAGYNLTSLGTSDWAHWGRGGVYGNLDRKSSGRRQISNVTSVGAGANVGSREDATRSVTWADGLTPNPAMTNEHGYIWSNGALNSGFSFTVPADTTTRTLTLYAGGYRTVGTLRAHLSDDSAPDYVQTASGDDIYASFYTITYKAASAGQTLTITLLKTQNIIGTNGSVDLIAAALTGPPPERLVPSHNNASSDSVHEIVT
jgi:hypothetical protein